MVDSYRKQLFFCYELFVGLEQHDAMCSICETENGIKKVFFRSNVAVQNNPLGFIFTIHQNVHSIQEIYDLIELDWTMTMLVEK